MPSRRRRQHDFDDAGMTCGYGVQGGIEDALAHSSTAKPKAAKPQDLGNAFLTHRDETEAHLERLQPIFEIICKRPRTETCEAVELVLEEDDEIAEDLCRQRGARCRPARGGPSGGAL